MKDKMLVSASKGYTTATDLADNLVRHLNITFRDAYKITAKVVNYAEKSKLEFEKLSLDEMKKIDSRITKKILDNIKVKNSIKSKKSYGGTSFENIKKMIKIYKKGIK